MISIFTLSNGIRVAAERMEHYRSVSMCVWIGTGSVFETDKESGAAHFIEHMLFKGTDKRSAADIAAEIDAVGGSMNAFTAKDCTCFYAKVMGDRLELAADMLADMLCHSKFDSEDIAREKGVVIEEMAMIEDSPEDVANEALCSLYYEGAPLARPILGTKASVSAFSHDSLTAYLRTHYTGENIVISCAGDFDVESLNDLLEAKFAGVFAGSKLACPISVPAGGIRNKKIRKDIEQAHICLGFPGYPTDTREQYPLFLLNNIIGGSMSSRLFQRIREEKGLAYSVYSYPSSYSETGYFTVYAGTGAEQAAVVNEMMMDELSAIKTGGVSDDEFYRAREQLRGSFLLGQESTSGRANAIGKAVLTRGYVFSEEEILAKIDAVSQTDVAAIIDNVLDTGMMSAVTVSKGK